MKRLSILGIVADVADTLALRMRGLIGRPPPMPGCGMLIPRCNAIHTMFMGYPIDVAFLDGRGNVVRCVKGVPPGKFMVWGGWRARQVLEMSAGAFDSGVVKLPGAHKTGSIAGGSKLVRLALPISLAVALLTLLPPKSVVAASEKSPNIIFILTDDAGYGDFGGKISTPNWQRLRAKGALLTDHYCAAPVCAPSRASILTGRSQGICMERDNCFDQPIRERKTLGTELQAAGYRTYAIGKWGLAGGGQSGLPRTAHPLDRGFDYFYGFLDHLAGHTYYHYDGTIQGASMAVWENREKATDAEGVYSTDLFVAKAKQQIQQHVAQRKNQPFFMYLAVNTIHGSGINGCQAAVDCTKALHIPGREFPAEGLTWPLSPEPRAQRNTWLDPRLKPNLPEPMARYATAIMRLDDALGDLMVTLERLGVADSTVIVITSDNGPADEYGADPRFFASADPFDGLKRDCFEGGMRVPTLLVAPGKVKPGSTITTPSASYDWMNTFLKLAGAVACADSDGCDILDGKPHIVYSEYNYPGGGYTQCFKEFVGRKGSVRGQQRFLRDGDWVLVQTAMGTPRETTRLYNVAIDPHEDHDLAGDAQQQPRIDQMLKEMARRHRPLKGVKRPYDK